MTRSRRRLRTIAIVTGALSLLGLHQGISTGAATPDPVAKALRISEERIDAVNDTSSVPKVSQNLIPGTLERRDLALAQFKAAGPSAAPLSRPEYAVVWAGKTNAGDLSLDAMVVLDVRKHNADGTKNPDYGNVVNYVPVPPPFGVEGEPHHMQYEWLPGQLIVAGHLFTDLTTIWDVSDIPNIALKNVIRPEENPQGTLPDAYDFVGDLAIGTYMGGPDVPNYGGSPGSVVVFKPDSAKGMVQVSERPASQFGAVFVGNPGGIPEPCDAIEGRPARTCGNPHGIQARPDLGRMVTNDYADARELATDPSRPPSSMPSGPHPGSGTSPFPSSPN